MSLNDWIRLRNCERDYRGPFSLLLLHRILFYFFFSILIFDPCRDHDARRMTNENGRKKNDFEYSLLLTKNTNHARAYVFNKFNDSINFFVHNNCSVFLSSIENLVGLVETMRNIITCRIFLSIFRWFFSSFYSLCVFFRLWGDMWINREKRWMEKKSTNYVYFMNLLMVPFIYESFWDSHKETFLLLFNEMHMFHFGFGSSKTLCACDIYLYLKNLTCYCNGIHIGYDIRVTKMINFWMVFIELLKYWNIKHYNVKRWALSSYWNKFSHAFQIQASCHIDSNWFQYENGFFTFHFNEKLWCALCSFKPNLDSLLPLITSLKRTPTYCLAGWLTDCKVYSVNWAPNSLSCYSVIVRVLMQFNNCVLSIHLEIHLLHTFSNKKRSPPSTVVRQTYTKTHPTNIGTLGI